MTRNRYSRALKILKSTEVEEKLSALDESLPTNHTKGLYSLNDPGFRVGEKDPAKVYYPDVDGNWPAGIPGTPGELEYVRPAGYWSGGSDWQTQVATDFSQDYLLSDPTGRSTTGLIGADGTVFSALPPGGESFILGPLIDGFVPNHTSDAYTNIGYIQKDTRQFVLLARISGQWKAGLNGSGYSVWNGTSTGLTIYNQNFTLEMAQWIRDKILADSYVTNVPYFYSGGVPQRPQDPAQCPNCPPGMYGGNGIAPRQFGSGGNPSIGTEQPAPRSGNSQDAGAPWGPDPGRAAPDPYGDLAILLAAAGIVGAAALAFKAAVAAGGSAALTAIASRLRYLAKLRMDRGALNPFGQTAVRSGAAGRQRIDVYTGRPYQGPRGNRTGTQYGTTNPQTGNTYTNPGPLRGMPGTGSQTNPAGTLDRGTLPQRYIDKYGSRSVLGQKQVKMSPSAARRTFGESVDSKKIDELSNEFIEKLFLQYPDAYDKVDQLLVDIETYLKSKKIVSESKEVLSESRKRILREIKNPVVVPEPPKKYKMNFAGKYSPQNIPDKTASKISDDLVASGNARGQRWRIEDKYWQGYETTERMNIIYDRVGHGDQYWEEIINENSRRKTWKTGEMQEHLNIMVHEKVMKEENPNYESPFYKQFIDEQETLNADKDPLFKKIAKKLKKEIDYPDKPSKNGVPNNAPPEMVNGYHPDYGKRKDYYKRLDPTSAKAMPLTGDPETDMQIKAVRKQPK